MKRRIYLILALCLSVLSSCGPRGRVIVGPVEILPTPPVGFIPECFDADSTLVRSGDSFTVLMNRLGLGASDAYALTQRCEGVFDVRKLRAGNPVQAYYETAPGGSRRLCYVVYAEDRVHSTVFQCADSLAVWRVEKPVVHRRRVTDVTINSSLWNDMIAAGGSPNLIMTLADIYQWSVNFFALQKNDRFRMIYTESVCEGDVVGIDTVHFCLFNAAAGKEVAAVRFDTGEGGRSTYWDKGGESLKRMFLKAPLKYNRISSRFSYARKHPVTGKVKAHTAVDYAAPTGTPVHAIGDGTVMRIGWDAGGGGNRIRLKHARGYETSYMHLSKYAPGLKVGTHVSQGQLIGYVGATGTATGPHLDFRVFQNGKAIDPLSLNSPASEPLDKKHLDKFNALYDKYIAELKTPVQAGRDAEENGD
ncbi:MAG: peptidoglycan DD-metalloendopeptidase family protein [Bacteroidales bacterium]|nr:peptidoglycan DD-metalloendopeptidase family protein [Bacteroidales bacterium]